MTYPGSCPMCSGGPTTPHDYACAARGRAVDGHDADWRADLKAWSRSRPGWLDQAEHGAAEEAQ